MPRCRALLWAALLAVSMPSSAAAQPKPQPASTPDEPDTYTNWVRREVRKALVAAKAIPENGNGVANQKEAPSIDQASTSLVDTSSATDFVSVALNLTGIARDEDEDDGQTDSGSVTANLYSLAAAIRGVSPTDPSFYYRKRNWRRVALTIGSEKSDAATHFTDKPATHLGFKLLLINNRDIYSGAADRHFASMDIAVSDYVEVEQAITNQLHCLIFRAVYLQADRTGRFPDCRDDPAFVPFLQGSPFGEKNWKAHREAIEKDAATTKAIQELIIPLATARRGAGEAVSDAVDRIQRGRQLAVAYFSKQREDDGTDEHRAEVIFDYGLSDRLNWTVNASFDFSDRKQREDTRSGRVATEFQAKLGGAGTRVWSARPVVLSGGGDASKDPDSEWLLRAQVKLVVPVTTGVDIPIAYTYANRDAEQITSGSRLKFSVALDPLRLRERFR